MPAPAVERFSPTPWLHRDVLPFSDGSIELINRAGEVALTRHNGYLYPETVITTALEVPSLREVMAQALTRATKQKSGFWYTQTDEFQKNLNFHMASFLNVPKLNEIDFIQRTTSGIEYADTLARFFHRTRLEPMLVLIGMAKSSWVLERANQDGPDFLESLKLAAMLRYEKMFFEQLKQTSP